jgi:hypothetical protein
MSQESDLRAEAAVLTMQRNRELLLAAYMPSARGSGQFPRSATFRWLSSHLSGGALASTLVSAALFKPSWLALLGRFLVRRRAR